MKASRINFEHVLYFIGITLALVIRFLNLGSAPLSDSEASWALQALDVAHGTGLNSQITIGVQPAYIFMTALLFELFGSSNFLARFWPALAGLLLVTLPMIMRKKIGRPVALIAAFGLAVDPGLSTVSRQAGGPMMALAFSLIALGLWVNRRTIPAGIMAGLALLSGPTVFHGLLGLGIGLTIFYYLQRRDRSSRIPTNGEDTPLTTQAVEEDLGNMDAISNFKKGLIAFGLTILFVGTFFFRFPQGLAALFQSLVEYLNGWIAAANTSPLALPAALVIYQPFALVLALIATGRWLFRQNRRYGRENMLFLISLFWLLAGIILALVYPARQVSDLVWVLAPLWLLAALEFEYYLPETRVSLVSGLQSGLILILAALFWNSLVSTDQMATGGNISPVWIRAALLLGILALGALTAVLVAMGWSLETSQQGTALGLSCAALVYLLSVLWGASQLRVNQPAELWGSSPGPGQAELLDNTLVDLSNRNAGMARQIEIVSVVDTPSLRWTLKDYPNTHFSSALAAEETPPILLTPLEGDAPSVTATYRGQDFVWRTWPGWTGVFPEEFIEWLTFRKAPITNEKIILWARSDLFPGGTLGAEQGGSANP